MCIYIYNPKQELLLEHVSETLTVEKGTYEIVLDMLVENCSKEILKEIFAIVPHSLFEVQYNPKTHKEEFIYTGTFKDITDDFKNKDSKRNEIYNQYPNEIGVKRKKDEEYLTIKQADPENPSLDKTFEGIVTGPNKLKIMDDLSYEEHAILSKNRISLLVCNIQPLLKPGDKGWLRWKITPETTTLTPQTLLERVFNWLRNHTIYRYKIIGPYSVKKKVYTKLLSFQKSLNSKDMNSIINSKETKSLFLIIENLIKKILYNHIEKGHTILTDWHINVYKKQLRNISIISQEGNIKPCGSQPNHLDSKIFGMGFQQVYQRQNIVKETDDKPFKDDFSIYFEVNFINIFHSLIVWLSLILAICSLIFSLTI